MQASDLPLREIHLPEAVAWWPPAIGWWLLVFLVLALVWLGFWFFRRLLHSKKAVRSAKKLLAELKNDSSLDQAQKLAKLSMLLRRVAISLSPDKTVAGLTGQAWLQYLDRNTTGGPFNEGVGRLLMESPYRQLPPSEKEISQLFELCEDWLKSCDKMPKPNKIR